MSLTEPTREETLNLINTLEKDFPSKCLGEDKWQILAVYHQLYLSANAFTDSLQVSALSAGGHPDHAATLYTHLISRPEYNTPTHRQALVRRLREALVKLVSVIGVPKPLESVFAIAEVEREEDKDYSFSR